VRLCAPALLPYEVTNAVHRYERAGYLTAPTVDRALEALQALPIHLVEDPALHREALALARRHALAATYDAHYLALAERLGCELWTADRRLIGSLSDDLFWLRLVEPPFESV
jgi:predicted nucleic acid-binding protein